ncbi:uncharacterized protein LOC144706135 isoform X2 [Wolffia australiana]
MGCGVSKPEDGAEAAALGRPIYRRFDDIRRLRLVAVRPRKHSTASNVGLLNPEEEDDESALSCPLDPTPVCTHCGSRLPPPSGDSTSPPLPHKSTPETQGQPTTPPAAQEEPSGGALLSAEGEELPGSPSFRVYFAGSEPDNPGATSNRHAEGSEAEGRLSAEMSNTEAGGAKLPNRAKKGRLRAVLTTRARQHQRQRQLLLHPVNPSVKYI